MIIKDGAKKVCYSDVKIGDVFAVDKNYFLCLPIFYNADNAWINAFNLSNNSYASFFDTDTVVLVNASLNIE